SNHPYKKESITTITQVWFTSHLGKYLGFCIFHSRAQCLRIYLESHAKKGDSHGQLEPDYSIQEERWFRCSSSEKPKYCFIGEACLELTSVFKSFIGQCSLCEIHMRTQHFYGHKKGSSTWNSILKALESLEGGFVIRLRDGNSSLWFDPWVSKTSLGMQYPLCELQSKDIWEGGARNLDKFYTILPPTSIQHTLNIRVWLVKGLSNVWVWNQCTL
ncbi:hypothetical protein CR513_44813, partial [Mucuna pruriens]